MKEKNFVKWQRVRKKGKFNFVFKFGVLGWGLPMFLFMTFIVNRTDLGHMSLGIISLNVLIWSFGGLGFGFFFWELSNRSYMKELNTRRGS